MHTEGNIKLFFKSHSVHFAFFCFYICISGCLLLSGCSVLDTGSSPALVKVRYQKQTHKSGAGKSLTAVNNNSTNIQDTNSMISAVQFQTVPVFQPEINLKKVVLPFTSIKPGLKSSAEKLISHRSKPASQSKVTSVNHKNLLADKSESAKDPSLGLISFFVMGLGLVLMIMSLGAAPANEVLFIFGVVLLVISIVIALIALNEGDETDEFFAKVTLFIAGLILSLITGEDLFFLW